jgi:hypothetical protein
MTDPRIPLLDEDGSHSVFCTCINCVQDDENTELRQELYGEDSR